MAKSLKHFASSSVGNIDNFPACKEILPVNYEYEVCSFKDESIDCFNQFQFNAIIRTTLLNKEEIKEWLVKFTKKSRIIFRVDRTHKPSLRTIFKVQYRCHHNTRPRKNSTPHAKHTRCNAKLTINVKNIKRPELSKDKYLPKFPTVITLRHIHNHPLFQSDSLKFSDPTPEVRKTFLELFQNGHNVSSSLSVYKMDLMESYEISDYDKIINDRSIIPNKRWIRYLYDKVFNKEFVKDTVAFLKTFIVKFNDKCGEVCAKIIEEKDKQFTCAIASPFMKRVHQLSNAGEYIIVDSSANSNRCLCKVYVLQVHTTVGGLPVGVLMVSTALKQRGLEKVLQSYVELLPQNCFGGKGTICGPSYIVSTISAEEKSIFSKIFPKSTQVESVYNSVKANWGFFWNQKHDLSTELIPRAYLLLKDLSNSENLNELLSNYENILLQPLCKENALFRQQVTYVFEHQKEWTLYRASEHIKEIQTVSNEVLRDQILTRTKATNPIQLLEFIVNSSMEEFYLSKIESAVLGQENDWFLNEFKEVASTAENKSLIVLDIDSRNSIFEVLNNKSYDKYLVDNLLGFCSCFLGRSGAKCSHQLAIKRDKDLPKFNFPLVTNNDEIQQFFRKVLNDRGRLADQFLNFNNGPNVLTSSVSQRPVTDNFFPYLACNDLVPNDNMIEKCQTSLQSVFEDILLKLDKNAGQFLPAINNFINSYKKLTDLEKMDALNNFANSRSNVESIVLLQYDPLS